jgi:hypothetical protein
VATTTPFADVYPAVRTPYDVLITMSPVTIP